MLINKFAKSAEFLAKALPWPTENGPRHFVNIHFRIPKKKDGKVVLDGKGKPVMLYPGRACTNVREAISVIEWTSSFEGGIGTDTYVCMSGQATAEEKLSNTGRTYHTAVRGAHNSILHKSFYVDVDVKPDDTGKGYPTTIAAAEEFGRIRRALGLPAPTMVVGSGSGGFHVHWTLTEAIPTATWEPIAHALVAGLLEHNFKGDTGCTTDRARLLRVPETWNHKPRLAGTGDRNPVDFLTPSGNEYLLDAIAKPLAKYMGRTTFPSYTPQPVLGVPSPKLALSFDESDLLGTGIDTVGPVTISQLHDACPWIRDTLISQGASNNNALWMLSVNAATFTTEGLEACHWMSAGHATYSPSDTDAMWQRQLATRQSRNLGWPKCATIFSNGAPQCQACPNLAKGKSPFNFVVRATVAETPHASSTATSTLSSPNTNPIAPHASATSPLPQGYSFGPHGVIMRTTVDEEGQTKTDRLCEYPMLKAWVQKHPAMMHFSTITAGKVGASDQVETQITFKVGLLYDKSAFAKELAEQHMVLPFDTVPSVVSFMNSWYQVLKQDVNNVVQSAPYGWYRHRNKLVGFIYANQVWSSGQPRPASNPDPTLDRQYTPAGELEPWKAAARMITDQGRPELDAMLASSFAAPLVALVGQTGLLMSTYSAESGIGKTTTMKVAASVWGNPKRTVQSLDDTINSVLKKIGDIKNLPMYWDELKTETDTQRFVKLAFQLSQGKEKSRLTSDVRYREPGTWETIMVATSNDALLNHITQHTKSTNAGVMRIFEFVVPPGVKGQIELSTAQQITAALDHNYGHAGLMYAKWLGQNPEAIAVQVDNFLHEMERRLHAKAEERFWLSLLVTIVMGAHYANHLQLTSINTDALLDFMVQKFIDMRGERDISEADLSKPDNTLGVLARYLNTKKPHHSVVTDVVWSTTARPPAGAVKVLHSPQRMDMVEVQYGQSTQVCRMLRAPFFDFLRQEQVSQRITMKQLTMGYNVKQLRAGLCAGTPFKTHQEWCLEFYYGDPVFRDIIGV